MTRSTIHEFVQPQWFLPLFVAMWFGITGLLSHIGGWASLASAFLAHDDVAGERFRFRSGSLGKKFFPVNYGNCLFFTVSESGFRLSILFPFRFLSPPIFIPWDKVESVEEKQVFFFSYHVVSIRDHWSRISVRGSLGALLKERFEAYREKDKGKGKG